MGHSSWQLIQHYFSQSDFLPWRDNSRVRAEAVRAVAEGHLGSEQQILPRRLQIQGALIPCQLTQLSKWLSFLFSPSGRRVQLFRRAAPAHRR